MLIQDQPFCVPFTLMFKTDFIQNTDCQAPYKTKRKQQSVPAANYKVVKGYW